jgi:hypothetical protein
MHRFLVTVALAAVAAVGLYIGVGSAKAPGGRTFRLVETEKGSTFHFIDEVPLAPTSHNPDELMPSPGDRFAITQPLATLRGQRAGTIYAECTFLTGGQRAALHCVGTMGLKGGQLALDTRLKGFGRVTKIAITGGTGAYEGARGSITSIERRNNTSLDTIHLLP